MARATSTHWPWAVASSATRRSIARPSSVRPGTRMARAVPFSTSARTRTSGTSTRSASATARSAQRSVPLGVLAEHVQLGEGGHGLGLLLGGPEPVEDGLELGHELGGVLLVAVLPRESGEQPQGRRLGHRVGRAPGHAEAPLGMAHGVVAEPGEPRRAAGDGEQLGVVLGLAQTELGQRQRPQHRAGSERGARPGPCGVDHLVVATRAARVVRQGRRGRCCRPPAARRARLRAGGGARGRGGRTRSPRGPARGGTRTRRPRPRGAGCARRGCGGCG